jgi:hypothetical protein
MALELFYLDKIAHDLVFRYKDSEDAVKEVYKMRTTVAYGLERFWGEKIRLDGDKAQYWEAVWIELRIIMGRGDIEVPNHQDIQEQVTQLWSNSDQARAERKVTLAVLTQLCDSMIWWTQRYKKS